MKWIIYAIMLFLLTGNAYAQKKTDVPMYKNATLPIEERVKDLLAKMTLEEKAGQLNQLNGGAFTGPALNDAGQKAKMQMVRDGKVGTLLNVIGAAETKAIQTIAVEQSRLGIPLLFGYDVIHGYKTIFPIPLAEACSWDLSQIEKNASIAAREASSAGINWTFAPMCDISNDPRWGRVMEGVGEDPWYGGLVSAARVKGLQGNLDNNHILACVKHYAGYGAVESGREYNYVDVSRVALWNKYLPPYKAAVEAGAATVMNGFNVFEGVPVSGSKYLVTDVLKDKWGFKGFLVSDWASFGEMVTWGYAADGKDAALKAFKAGSMIDMESKIMGQFVPELVKEGKITMPELDEVVGRILYYKFKLGLFDKPYQYSDAKKEAATLFTAAHRKEALEAAKRSIILLKNNNNILPLKASPLKIGLVGYYAASKSDLFDFWIAQGDFKNAVTLQEGLGQVWGQSSISFSNGYNADATTTDALIGEAVKSAQSADVIVVNIGLSGKLAGEDRSLANPVIPQGQVELLKALKQTGKPIVAVVSAGRPLVLTQVEPLADAIVYSWILGTEGGNAMAAVLSGAYNPSAKTVISFPYAVGQIPVYYNHFNTGRPVQTDGQGNWFSRYRDIPREAYYPFGYGLSYTKFDYSNLQLSSPAISKGETLKVNVTVKNSGNFDGEEVVQLYIRDIASSIIRPVKELKGFQKVSLKKGESQTLTFELDNGKLSYFDEAGNTVLEPGKFSVFVGGNSRDVLESSFELK
ncbi:beta-glucosidase BglX [Chitinophagaceae bacterium LB-8]|uniref:beta-glucosidase n=1 Tax=Paraflavisolibacter caeni TaxID=2982496 RepID=A0A9X2XV80_9BACT|nr:beta-glucosidase BglX [Paraflavisolibacter caeni]MCU7548987.1 beta-glucosidase BglX [Paraflavisolibacter caeni]